MTLFISPKRKITVLEMSLKSSKSSIMSKLDHQMSKFKKKFFGFFKKNFFHDLFISPKRKNTILEMSLKSSIMSKLDHQMSIILIEFAGPKLQPTLQSGIDVGQGINVGPGKFGKKNKRRALNKH